MNANLSLSLIFLGLTFLSCNQSSQSHISGNSDSINSLILKDTLSINEERITSGETDLDIDKFIVQTEEFLSIIERRQVILSCTPDTLRALDKRSYYDELFSLSGGLIKRFTFEPSKNSSLLKILYLEATYNECNTASIAFEALRRQANGADGEDDYLPGLTYTNDYVIKSKNKIYWLNTGCAFSFSNHKKLASLMLQSLNVINIQDSIWCKCGDVNCN